MNGWFLGKVFWLSDFYDLVDVVINFVIFGMGLKIKNLEVFVFGKCLIMLVEGFWGMFLYLSEFFLVVLFLFEMGVEIIRLLGEFEVCEWLVEGVWNYVLMWFSEDVVYREL